MDPKRPFSASSTPAPCPVHHKLSLAAFAGDLACNPFFNVQPNANSLADSLGVSPLYQQRDSQRWQTAAHVYHSSRSHSPAPTAQGRGPAAAGVFNFPADPMDAVKSPLSLEEIGSINRRRCDELASGVRSNDEHGALELEAIAAVHELSSFVQSIYVSEMLPRTRDLIFVNVKTHEDLPFTLELTMKGWRVASTRTDSMYGDYLHLDLHTQYFNNARHLLDVISPGHNAHFNDCLAERLRQLQAQKDGEESFAEERWRDLDCESPTVVSIPVPQRGRSVEIDQETMFS